MHLARGSNELTELHFPKKVNRKREKNTYSQTSRLENLEELQLNHNHENVLFLTVLLLFEQYKMHYWWLAT
jgi:hypothetical protein